MAVHRIAAQGFGSQAETYDRARPGYPDELVRWCVDRLGIGPGRRVLDLAAGTGKLTALLAPFGSDLVAVEPVGGMRAVLRDRLPGVPLLAGTAEALPFADAVLDAVTVAQAFHWFDGPAAIAELARVVRPGGRMALVWNARDRTVEWVDLVWQVLDRLEKHAPWRDHERTGPDGVSRWTDRDLVTGELWTPFAEQHFRHLQDITPADVAERMRSVSHVAVLPPAEQEAVLDEIRTLLREHPDTRGRDRLQIPYRVDCLLTERRP